MKSSLRGFFMEINELIRAKKSGKKWALLTAYDAPTAETLEKNGIDWVLVGDSLGMVVLGYPTTTVVTMDEMLHHTRAVRRGAPNSFIIGDMPLLAVNHGTQGALKAAREFCKAGANAVKVEWREDAPGIARALVRARIPVMGHVGLTPQTAGAKGFKMRGADAREAVRILARALSFEKEGAFAVLLECVPAPVARAATRRLKVPTIGIGAGAGCDGQILVFHDLVGWFSRFRPRFVKRYVQAERVFGRAVQRYAADVRGGRFPGAKQSFKMENDELKEFSRWLKKTKS